MFVQFVGAALLIVFALVSTWSVTRERVDKTCREHPQLVGKCFRVRGKLSVYNGAPAVRLLNTATRRMLGISEQRFNLTGYRNLPESIEQQLNQDTDLVGDFLVCPFTKSKPHEMQLICIESVKNLEVRKRNGP